MIVQVIVCTATLVAPSIVAWCKSRVMQGWFKSLLIDGKKLFLNVKVMVLRLPYLLPDGSSEIGAWVVWVF